MVYYSLITADTTRLCLRLLRVLWACRCTKESSITPPLVPGLPAPWVSCCYITATITTTTSILLLLLLISLPPYYYYITILTYHAIHNQCPPSTDKVPYSAEEWSPEVAGLSPWEADEGQVMSMKQTLFQYNQDKPSYARWVLYVYNIVSLCRGRVEEDGSTWIYDICMHYFDGSRSKIDIFLLIFLMYMYLIFMHYITPTTIAYFIQTNMVLLYYTVLWMYRIRFTGPFRNDYTGVGMMGFNVWEQNAHCRYPIHVPCTFD